MNHFKLVLVTWLCLLSSFVKAQTPFDGEGTSESPYKIYTAIDFGRIRDYQDCHFEIMNNIDMHDYLVENFGDSGWMPIEEFTGEINGNGFIITGFYAKTNNLYSGIFKKVEYATIKNIGVEYVEDIVIKGGTLFIELAKKSNITGCFVKAKSISFGSFSNSSIWFGGLVNNAYTSVISDNYVVFDEIISNDYGDIGGLCTNSYSCTIVGNSVKGDIISNGTTSNLSWSIGGLIGDIDYDPTWTVIAENVVSNNKFEGDVVGKKRVGGLFAEMKNSKSNNTITYNLVVGNVYGEGAYRVGGLCSSIYASDYEVSNNVLIIDTISGGDRSGYIAAYYPNGYYNANVFSNKRFVNTVKMGGYTEGGPKEEPVTVGKTLLMSESTYSDMGWDFNNYWEIDECKSYPCLRIEKQWLNKLDTNSPTNSDRNENVVDTDISLLPNTTYISNFEINSGKNATISLKLKNSTIKATGFQCDIYLPEGCTFLQDSDGFYLASLSTERTTAAKTNYFDSSLQDDGSLRILCNSTKGYAFSGTDGEVATIDIMIPEELKDGTYPIYIRNIRITEATGSAELGAKIDSVKSSMIVLSYELGDANGDGEISVNDFSAVANSILGNIAEGFVAKAADVNEDEEITVNDLSSIAYYILNGQYPWMISEVKTYRSPTLMTEELSNKLYINPLTIEKGATTATLSLNMLNDIVATGFQCDIYLPEGFTFAKDIDGFFLTGLSTERTTSRKTNYFDCALQADGALRILCNSTGGYAFEGTDGEVAKIAVDIDSNIHDGVYKVIIRKAELADKTGNNGVKINEDVISDITYGKPHDENFSNIQMSSYGISTYCSTHCLDFTNVEGLKAYVASGYDEVNENVQMTRVYEVPAATGIILVGGEGTYSVPYATSTLSLDFANLLKGVTIATTIEPASDRFFNYVLAEGTKGIGFYPIGEEGVLAAGKAYLQLPESTSAAKGISMLFDETTGIEENCELATKESNSVVYDIMGRKVVNPSKGLYIKNGKKVIIK